MHAMQDEAVAKAAIIEREVHDLIRAGKLNEAVEACKRLNHEYPAHISGWFTASRLALKVNEPQIALRAIEQALVLSPGQPELLLQRLVCLGVLDDLGQARQLGEALGPHPFPDAARSATAGAALSRVGLYELANDHFERAAELEPGIAGNHYNLATTLRALGRTEEAEQRLDRALEIDPGDSQAHILRSGLRTQTADSNHISELSDAILHATTDPDRVHLGFALAKEWEDLGEYENAFHALSGAAKLRRAAQPYDPRSELDMMRRIRDVFDADTLSQENGHVNAAPIFIVGLPCTGTSLVDDILGAHPVVTSAGELRNFALELQKLCQDAGSQPLTPTDLVDAAGQVDFEALGEAYIESTRSAAGEAAHFVDKMSTNFLYCGLIHLALPKAKIVLLQRDPMDTCFAQYRTLFDGGYSYSYDLDELAHYVVEYRRLAGHWIECLGEGIHIVRYEDLVSEHRSVVERLLDYCGLTHDAACFDVHRQMVSGDRASASLSSPSGRWLNYEDQLRPLTDILTAAGVIESG